MVSIFNTDYGFATDKGKVRQKNEDSILIIPSAGFAAVADGMGGHKAGDVASSLAVEIVKDYVLAHRAETAKNPYEMTDISKSKTFSRESEMLFNALKQANEKISETSRSKIEYRGMGTTFSAVLISEDKVSIAHIGDTRIYILRNGELLQITNDHSFVMEQVRLGLISREEASSSLMQNVLTRAMGTAKDLRIDVSDAPLFKGDRILLCSDGLFKAVPENEIRAIIGQYSHPQDACDALINKANENGSPDNVSVIIINLNPPLFSAELKEYIQNLFKGK